MLMILRNTGPLLNLGALLDSEDKVLELLGQTPYAFKPVDLPRTRNARQRLIDRGMIESNKQQGVLRKYCLTPRGREYLGISEDSPQN